MLNLVIHFDSSIFIDRYNHTFSKKSSSWEVVGNILCYFI